VEQTSGTPDPGIALESDRRLLRGRLLSSSFRVGGVAPTSLVRGVEQRRTALNAVQLAELLAVGCGEHRLAFHLDAPEAFRVKVTSRRSVSSRFVGWIT